MTEKLDFIDQTDSSKASEYDFKTIYRDMNMIFTWKDQKFYGNNVDGLAEMYNDKLKEKTLSLSHKQQILWKHYTSLRDTNEKVICSQDLCNKMNDKQRSYIIFVQNPAKPNEVHARASTWFYVGLAKAKAI